MSDAKSKKTFEIQRFIFDQHTIDLLADDVWSKNLWPIVYILSSASQKQAYVGESTTPITRLKTHLQHPRKGRMEDLRLIRSPQFHKSATLDIEALLIRYLTADNSQDKYQLQNGNFGLTFHNYYEKEEYQLLFADIWQYLQEEKIAIQDLKAIDNSDLFKFSPYKALSPDQYQSVLDLIEMLTGPQSSALVTGGAGTGKTVLAIFMMKLLISPLDDLLDIAPDELEFSKERRLITKLKTVYPKPKIALVIPMVSLRNTLKAVFKNVRGLNPGMVIGPSDVVGKHYDILIVDEAHRLRQRKNITNYRSFDENNKTLALNQEGTELDWILISSKKQIFFYDQAQSVKPSDVDESRFSDLQKVSKQLILQSQLRIKGGINYISYIDKLLNLSLPKKSPFFEQENYEFLYFDHIADFARMIAEKEKKYQLSRMIAGYSWEWKSKKEPNEMDIEIEGMRFQWNQQYNQWINSTNAAREIGCIHTTQGYDLNYAGVIFGNEISYNPDTGELNIHPERFYDKKTKAGITDPGKLKQYILNIYQNMLRRGIKGVFVYACDPGLKAYFKKHIRTFKS